MPPSAWQRELRHERQRDADRDLREHHAERRAQQRQHDRFRQQLTHDPPASRAEGHAHGQFAAARGEARHLQVRDVDAGDQQHERHRPEQDQQQRAHRLRAVLLQADRARERADVRRECALGRECAGGRDRRIVHQRRQFRCRAFLRHAWLHAAQQQEKRAPAGVAGPAIEQKDVRFRQRAEPGTTGLKLKSGGSTPTMVRGRPSMVMDCPTIAGSALSDVRHSRSLTIAARIVVWRRGAGEERAAARGSDAQRGEEIRTHVERGQLQRLAASGELRVDRGVGREMIERGDARAQRLVRHGRPGRERPDALLGLLR